MTLFEYREQQLAGRQTATWDVVEIDDLTVTERQLEPEEFEQLKAEWLGRDHGPTDRMG